MQHERVCCIDLSNNTALTDLNCSDNQLTSLDVSNNTVLTELFCYVNQLTLLDLRNNFLSSETLCSLSCYGNPLERIVLSKRNNIFSVWIDTIIEEYGDIITYVD